MNKKMVNRGTVNSWPCVNFSRSVQDSVARSFYHELAQMCQISDIVFNPEPVIHIDGARPDQVERVLKTVYKEVINKLKGRARWKELQIKILHCPRI